MPTSLSREQLLHDLQASGLFSQDELAASLAALPALRTADGSGIVAGLRAAGKLTAYQAAAIDEGRLADLVIGNYQILERLGAGGMGTVYKARHRRMKRVVALKVLGRDVSRSAEFVQRFQREVEAVARLSHPNIVTAHDADEAPAGPFLVMEFVNGRDLASTVEEQGPLAVGEAVRCVLQAARALEYAHSQGVIHRDIKPANLLRDAGGVVKVADLGLARFQDARGRSTEEQSALTQAGTIMGTVDYMPPEQAFGDGPIDGRADIYSLGCTLHFLLLGRPPYKGPTPMAILMKHRDAAIPSLRALRAEVPAALDEVFRRMLAKTPTERVASMTEVVRALETLVAGLGAVEPVPPPVDTLVGPALARAAAPGGTETVGKGAASGTAEGTVNFQPSGKPGAGTVLLVEPSRSQAVIIRGYLQKLRFEDVRTLSTGQQALDSARQAPPAVVLSAMHLPDMTGLQLVQAMRAEERFSATGLVLITSQADAPEAHLLAQAGTIVCLPKPFNQDQLARALAAAGESSRRAPAAGKRLRVLVVDDSAAARRHICGVLAALGLSQIVETADGAEAVARLEQETFDLVVTDYVMPHLDGRGLIDFIRHRSTCRRVPVILVTSETDPAKLAAVRQLGVSAICDKSFPLDMVRGVVATLE
jgi:serine/threonine-protein kinase